MYNSNLIKCKGDCPACDPDLKKLCRNENVNENSCKRKLTRSDICDIVKETICGERTDTHGNPEDSFADIATMWSLYLQHDIAPADVCNMMILLKICRYIDGKPMLDHLVDIAGYAAIAAEILSQEGKI